MLLSTTRNSHRSSCTESLFLSNFKQISRCLTYFNKSFQYQILSKSIKLEATDMCRQTDVARPAGTFRNSAKNLPKNNEQWSDMTSSNTTKKLNTKMSKWTAQPVWNCKMHNCQNLRSCFSVILLPKELSMKCSCKTVSQPSTLP